MLGRQEIHIVVGLSPQLYTHLGQYVVDYERFHHQLPPHFGSLHWSLLMFLLPLYSPPRAFHKMEHVWSKLRPYKMPNIGHVNACT